MDGLGGAACGGDIAVGGVGIGGVDVTGGAEYLAHVLGEVKAVGVPCAVLLDSQRAGSDGLTRRHPIAASPLRGKLASRFVQSPSEPSGALGRIPSDEPKPRVVAAGEVDAGDLQVTAVQIALVQRYGTVDVYLLEAATAHAVVRAGDHGTGGFVGEADGAVLCVVDGGPDAGLGLDERLVTVGIEDGREAEVCFIFRTGDA